VIAIKQFIEKELHQKIDIVRLRDKITPSLLNKTKGKK
jgi:hypothetical protein